jgi:hypothetical protein
VKTWLLVDDQSEEARSFARVISESEEVNVVTCLGSEAEEKLVRKELDPAGILMDVDLSGERRALSSGPGIAQNIRLAQQSKNVSPFPVIRFSLRARVRANIGSDTSSDDLFDLLVEKDGLADPENLAALRRQMLGVNEVYAAVQETTSLIKVLGISDSEWILWGHPSFLAEFESRDRPHTLAWLIMRMLNEPGPLIDQVLLSYRLGIEIAGSDGWPNLLEEFNSFHYRGTGSVNFDRWWARGLENWWTESLGAIEPLARSTIDERHGRLEQQFPNLRKLVMPAESPGERPWRFCSLTKEEGQSLPVDPA